MHERTHPASITAAVILPHAVSVGMMDERFEMLLSGEPSCGFARAAYATNTSILQAACRQQETVL